MRRFFPHPWGWASMAPMICAVHCAVTPLLVVFAPAVAPGETLEFALYGMTLVVASWALAKGLRQHGNFRPVVPITLGLLFWGASILHLFHPVPEELTTILAAIVVAWGLIWNSRLHCAVDAESACACTSCETELEGDAPTPSSLPGLAGTPVSKPASPVVPAAAPVAAARAERVVTGPVRG
jgi:hypothetical protein